MRLKRRQKREARGIAREKWTEYCQKNPMPDPDDFVDNESHPLFEAVRNDERAMKWDVQTLLLVFQAIAALYQLWSLFKKPEPSTVIDAEEWRLLGEEP